MKTIYKSTIKNFQITIHLTKISLLSFILLMMSTEIVKSQSTTGMPCYSVAMHQNGENYLYEFNPETYTWNEIGATGKNTIQSIAVTPDGTIYAVDGGFVGTLDPNTGAFSTINVFGDASGEWGLAAITNIYGLAYSMEENVLYAIERIPSYNTSFEEPSNDLLLKIDPDTGAMIENSFIDSNGNPSDYAIIEAINDANGPYYDVIDLAFHPETNELYIITDVNGSSDISTINKLNGKLTQVLFNTQEPLTGIGFDIFGDLYGPTNVSGNDPESSKLVHIDLEGFNVNINANPMRSTQEPTSNFLCFDCVITEIVEAVNKFPCYSVAIHQNGQNYLYKLNTTTGVWSEVGNTGKSNIQSIAIDKASGIIYAVDANTLGTLDPATGSFSTISLLSQATGEWGTEDINEIYGLAFDDEEQVLYATERIFTNSTSENIPSNDLLVKIDPHGGRIITDSFIDSNGNPADYAIIEAVLTPNGHFYDVIDLAFHPETNELYTLTDVNGSSDLSTINKLNGKLTAVLFDTNVNFTGIGFDNYNDLYGSIGVQLNDAETSKLAKIDLEGITVTIYPNGMHPTQNPAVSFLCFDCVRSQTNGCPEDLVHSGMLTNDVFQVSNSITSTATIGSSESVIYDAGKSICLDKGFYADGGNGSFFLGSIEGCTQLRKGNTTTTVIEQSPVAIKNFPNPFKDKSTIELDLNADTTLSMYVSDITGKQIATLINDEYKQAGTHQYEFIAQNLTSGVYYCTLIYNNKVSTHKMMLME